MIDYNPIKNLRKITLATSLAAVLLSTMPITPVYAQSLGDLASAAKGRGTALFNTVEFRSKSFKALPQWSRVLRKAKAEIKYFNTCVSNQANCKTPQQKSWRKIIKAAKNMTRKQKLMTVDLFHNNDISAIMLPNICGSIWE